jgi:UV DNA damage endonuclease
MKYGYACINTALCKLRPKIYVNRSMIQKTFKSCGLKYASELALKNVTDLFKVKWNNNNNIHFYRMSSNMFPWMSEYELNELPDFKKIKNLLKNIGIFVNQNNHRLTFHPGPFNVLASPKQFVVNKTVKEINQHAQIMDLMNLEQSSFSKINVHIGGVYKSKIDSLKRWCDNYNLLSQSAKNRLTVENDDKINCYNINDLLFVHLQLNVPLVLDYHHHFCNPGKLSLKDAVSIVIQTWNGITPVIHISQQRDNLNIRAHSDFITEKFHTFNYDVDVMFEAKMKEQALIQYRQFQF